MPAEATRVDLPDLPRAGAPQRGVVSELRDDRSLGERARDLINGDRQDHYGAPADNLRAIGWTWGAMLGLDKPIPSWRVALMMSALKTVRAAHQPTDDSLVDGAGYLELARDLRPDPTLAWHDIGLVGGKR